MFHQNLQHCFVENLNANCQFVELEQKYFNHFIKVLRFKIGDALSLTNGQGLQSFGNIIDIDFKNTTFKLTIHEHLNHPYHLPKISVGLPLLKQGFRLEFMIEKLVELGVFEVYPLICEHTGFYKYNWQRIENIVESSLEQSLQFYKPIFKAPLPFTDFLKQPLPKHKFIAHCAASQKHSLSTIEMTPEVLFIFGPEGDFSNQEINQALESNFLPISLGQHRLRSETAVIASVAAYKYIFSKNE